jgi:protein SCO1/2
MSRKILALIAVLALALAILTGLAVRRGVLGPQPESAAVGGPFQLVDTNGRTVDQSVLKGKWSVVFFGFTHCPDICPTTLALMKQVEDMLAAPPLAPPLQLLFVSVDPARDDPATLGQYAAYFSPNIIAATAPEERLQPMTRSLGIVYMQSPLDGGGYTIDHSAQVVVIDPKGRLVGMFRPPLDPQRMAADLRRLAEAGA